MSKMQFTEVLDFWFSEQVRPLWFKKSEDFDRQIQQRFEAIYHQAKTGNLNHWQDAPESAIALIIVLDQFPRNMFRQTPQSFATDSQAVAITKHALNHQYQLDLNPEQQIFLYMPLMHSEQLEDQALCVELFTQLGKTDNIKFALKHQEIIQRFGRFPHRNQILGRESTPTELEFLTQPGSSF